MIAIAFALSGCHRARPAEWETAPLLPHLQFDQVIPPRSVALLLVDAHSGAPVRGAAVVLDHLAPAFQTDSNGRVTLIALAPGRHAIRTMAIRYMSWGDSIDVPDSAGDKCHVHTVRITAQLQR